jgi:hypothetical protein
VNEGVEVFVGTEVSVAVGTKVFVTVGAGVFVSAACAELHAEPIREKTINMIRLIFIETLVL